MGTLPDLCMNAEGCRYWDYCIEKAAAIDEGTTAPSVEILMGYAIEHDPEIPSIEDEYLDMMFEDEWKSIRSDRPWNCPTQDSIRICAFYHACNLQTDRSKC